MKITCATEDGLAIILEVYKTTTIEDLRKRVAEEFKTFPFNIILRIDGKKEIGDEETMETLEMEDGGEITVYLNEKTVNASGVGTRNGVIPEDLLKKANLDELFEVVGMRKPKPDHDEIKADLDLATKDNEDIFKLPTMLYIPVTLRGTPSRAFIDSGSQNSLISKAFALKTKLIELVDPRFEGTAFGLGATRVVGKVHDVPLSIGEATLPVSFYVIDGIQTFDFLLGMDFLKWYNCTIDVVSNNLVVGTTDEKIDFMSAQEIKDAKAEEDAAQQWPKTKNTPGGRTGVKNKNPMFPKHYLNF